MAIYSNPVQGNGVVGAQLHPNFSQQSAGAAPRTETLTSAPVSLNTSFVNVALVAGGFQG